MGYFGGYGGGRGYIKTQFLLTAEDLEQVYRSYPMWFIVDRDVERIQTPNLLISEFVERYELYLNALLAGRETAKGLAYDAEVTIAASLDALEMSDSDEPTRKLLNLTEPIIHTSPLFLEFFNGKLYTGVGDGVLFGLEMSFPKVVTFFGEGDAIQRNTDDYAARPLYDRLRTVIQAKTKPCRIESPVRVHRTQIRISESLIDPANSHPGMIAQQLRVVR